MWHALLAPQPCAMCSVVWQRNQKPHKSEASINFRVTAKFKIVYKATQDAASETRAPSCLLAHALSLSVSLSPSLSLSLYLFSIQHSRCLSHCWPVFMASGTAQANNYNYKLKWILTSRSEKCQRAKERPSSKLIPIHAWSGVLNYTQCCQDATPNACG